MAAAKAQAAAWGAAIQEAENSTNGDNDALVGYYVNLQQQAFAAADAAAADANATQIAIGAAQLTLRQDSDKLEIDTNQLNAYWTQFQNSVNQPH